MTLTQDATFKKRLSSTKGPVSNSRLDRKCLPWTKQSGCFGFFASDKDTFRNTVTKTFIHT
jgi:hypothetical protein